MVDLVIRATTNFLPEAANEPWNLWELSMGYDKPRKGHDRNRDSGGFMAIPWKVIDSAAYQGLSHPAKALLFEIARQYVRDNNGRLLASRAYLKPRGWNSADTISRALRELVKAGLIHQTVQGHRPNKASWYAVTWRTLDRIEGYDPGAAQSFERSSYEKTSLKNACLSPSAGLKAHEIRPAGGLAATSIRPPKGTNHAISGNYSGP